MVHDPKPPLHSHNSLSFGKFQDTERFLIDCERHFSSRLPPSGGTWKHAKAPNTKKTWRYSLSIDMLLSAVSVLVVAQSSSEIPEGLMNNPVYRTLSKAAGTNDSGKSVYLSGSPFFMLVAINSRRTLLLV